MAFADALDLRTAVVEAVGDASIVDVWPRLVKLAEARLNRELRTRYQIASVPFTGSLPADYLEMAALVRDGRAYHWTPNGSIPAGSYDMEYYQALPTLADSLTASNWALQKYPDLYLYAAAAEAARYRKDMEQISALEAAREQAMTEARLDDTRARYGQAVIRLNGPTP